jgi:anhydro-N-acetylmuramic acid kinase
MSVSNKKNNSALVLGLMSGTSLDGLDLALCRFEGADEKYTFRLLKARTFEYPAIWRQRLSSIKDASAEKYFAMNALYGRYIAEKVNEFLEESEFRPIAIASHGHTVFHQPHAGFTTQMGCGATISANTGITTISDFRSIDVAHGGQGAPLVPVGDKYLFGDFQACLNLGGIANISYDVKGQRIAYDICVANMLLNYLAEINGEAFDEGGEAARAGKVDQELLDRLGAQAYYSQEGAKSIGREWFEKNILELFEDSSSPVNDLLATGTEHIASVLAGELNSKAIKNVLVTGGGAFNTFLIERLRTMTTCEIVLPDEPIINFKEAIIFAFLGFLRMLEIPNALKTVTGAEVDSVGGAVYFAGK